MSETASTQRAAAFYDLDGTLVNGNIVHAYLYYALRLPKVRQRIARLAAAAIFSPAYALTELVSRSLFNRLFYTSYRGISRDRLQLMGREVAQKAIMPRLYLEARRKLEKGRELGLLQVLVSGSLDMVLNPLTEELQIDHLITNRLEFDKQGRASGRLLPPVLAGKAKERAIREFALQKGIDLSRSYAFGDSKADLPMLEAVGFPCAVNPQRDLLQIAQQRNWPIIAFT